MTDIDALLEQRGQSWGDAVDTHTRIGLVWTGIHHCGQPFNATEVALMEAGLKLVRGAINPDDPDSFDDGQGYLKIAKRSAGHQENQDQLPLNEWLAPGQCSIQVSVGGDRGTWYCILSEGHLGHHEISRP